MMESKGNVLVVDDEIKLVERVASLIGKYADRIFTAYNGPEAMAIVRENKIHCIVCDIKMPGMSGLDVIKELRRTGNMVPFIFFTSYGENELMVQSLEFGAYDFIVKPKLDTLIEVVQRALNDGLSSQYSSNLEERIKARLLKDCEEKLP